MDIRMFHRLRRHFAGMIDNQNFIYLVITVPTGLVHVALLIFFALFGVSAMVYLNILSIAVYAYCINRLGKGRNPISCFLLMYFEILVHSFMAAVCVGWELGFAQYIVGLVPFGYHICLSMGTTKRQKYLLPTLMGTGSFLSYLLCRYIGVHQLATVYRLPLSVDGEYAVYVFNTICLFSLLFWSSAAFIMDINHALDGMQETYEYLKNMAYVDPLTGLYNRRHMMELFMEAGEDYCVIMCDIDNFKRVNDGYGHDFGDLVLKDTAALIRNEMENAGHICRWGGEEVVILHRGSFEEACHSAESIRADMQAHGFTMYNKTIHCSMTMGVAAHVKGETPDETVKHADMRLYWGKQNGKNMVVMEDRD